MPRYKEKVKDLFLPVIPLHDTVAFPGIPISIESDDKETAAAVAEAESHGMQVLLVCIREEQADDIPASSLYPTGTVARINRTFKNKNKIQIVCEGSGRAEIREFVKTGSLIEASAMLRNVEITDSDDVKLEAYRHEMLRTLAHVLTHFNEIPNDLARTVRAIEDTTLLCDFVASTVLVRTADKQAVLDSFEPLDRFALLIALLETECELIDCEQEINRRARESIARGQREYFLREQMKAIREELGENDDPDDMIAAIASADLPDEVREKLMKENERLLRTSYGSAEANVLRNYLDICLEIPWKKKTKDRVSVSAAKKILDADHDGMEKIKERILEFIAVKQLSPDLKNQIICLVGAPGTGKTSVAESIARALKRKYVRVSLGGIHDESDIRGHRKTYVAAMPGRIINAIKTAGVKNPLILLDEIDKLGASQAHGDPSSALLEVLDPEQNKSFRDHFVELPFDLSECIFITTANTLTTVPRPLLDRMEIIEMPSYSRREKLSIAKNHLIPKQLRRYGMTKRQLKLTDRAIYDIIDSYTHEAGVRNLERKLGELIRKAARKIVEDGISSVSVDMPELRAFLGNDRYPPERIESEDLVGVVNGLAYTEMGGDLLKVEVAVLDGSGKLEITGQLGDVMKESAKAALTYVRSIAADYAIKSDFYKTKDIHIHVPEGAVPKDGPSAGVTMTTALLSALSGIPVAHDIAMTGEVTLTGRVLAIGGLREKTMAAYAAGVRRVCIPHDNIRNLDDIDPEVRAALTFIPCKRVSEVIEAALVTDAGASAKEREQISEVTYPKPSLRRPSDTI